MAADRAGYHNSSLVTRKAQQFFTMRAFHKDIFFPLFPAHAPGGEDFMHTVKKKLHNFKNPGKEKGYPPQQIHKSIKLPAAFVNIPWKTPEQRVADEKQGDNPQKPVI